MKYTIKMLCICIFMLVAGGGAFAQEQAKIVQLLETQRQAWNKGDVNGFMQGYWQSDSLLFVGSTGPVYGWKTTLENYKKRYRGKTAMGNLTFDIKEVRLLDDNNAFVLGGWKLKRQADSPGGFFTLLLKKFNGVWKIVADHSS